MSARSLAHRTDTLWLAALVHRLSGLALAIFLPFHFLALGLAIGGAGSLQGFLDWTQQPLVKLAEGGLVFLFAVHLLGGLRLLWIENFAWREGQKGLALLAAALSAAMALGFLLILFDP
jgi:succinate dehydrogenase subunit D